MRCSSRILALTLTSCTVGLGCGSTLDDPEGTPGQSIGASGGYVSSADGVFTVVFPPGSLLETTLVSVTPASDAPESIATPYAITGPSALGGEIYLQYRYTIAQVQNREVENLRLGASTGDRWDELPDPIVDTQLQTVRASSTTLAPAFGLVLGFGMGTDTEMDTLDDSGSTSDDSGSTSDDPTNPSAGSESGSSGSEDTDDPTGSSACDNDVVDPGELCWSLGEPLVGKGVGPLSLTVGELDGMPGEDISVTLQGSSAIGVWFADGEGSAGPELLLPVTGSPVDVALGDFNDDGSVDVAGVTSAGIALFPGDGMGNFDAEVSIPIAGGALTAAAVDVNEDDASDIVVLRSSAASVLMGQDMLLGDEATFAAGTSRVALALGDATLDQNVDIITVGSGSITVLSGNGSGLFGKPQSTDIGGTPVDLAVGHFNGDDALDVAVLDGAGARIVVFLGNSLGGFGGAIPYAVAEEPAALEAADVDADGLTDLVVVTTSDDAVTVLHGQGNGSFDAGDPLLVGARPSDLALGDINGDGALDAIVLQEDGSIGLLVSAP